MVPEKNSPFNSSKISMSFEYTQNKVKTKKSSKWSRNRLEEQGQRTNSPFYYPCISYSKGCEILLKHQDLSRFSLLISSVNSHKHVRFCIDILERDYVLTTVGYQSEVWKIVDIFLRRKEPKQLETVYLF